MTPEQFAYWLQGFVEIHGSAPTTHEWTIIKDHLATVFKKITPDRQPYPLGPGIVAPTYPTWPNPLTPFTTTPTYTKPDLICSTSVSVEGASNFSPIPQGDSKLLF